MLRLRSLWLSRATHLQLIVCEILSSSLFDRYTVEDIDEDEDSAVSAKSRAREGGFVSYDQAAKQGLLDGGDGLNNVDTVRERAGACL